LCSEAHLAERSLTAGEDVKGLLDESLHLRHKVHTAHTHVVLLRIYVLKILFKTLYR